MADQKAGNWVEVKVDKKAEQSVEQKGYSMVVDLADLKVYLWAEPRAYRWVEPKGRQLAAQRAATRDFLKAALRASCLVVMLDH